MKRFFSSILFFLLYFTVYSQENNELFITDSDYKITFPNMNGWIIENHLDEKNGIILLYYNDSNTQNANTVFISVSVKNKQNLSEMDVVKNLYDSMHTTVRFNEKGLHLANYCFNNIPAPTYTIESEINFLNFERITFFRLNNRLFTFFCRTNSKEKNENYLEIYKSFINSIKIEKK